MNQRIFQTCLASGLLLWGGYALAIDKVDFVDVEKGDGINITAGKIFINPINGNYGQASSSTMTYHLKAKAGCKGQNVIKEFFVSLGTENVTKLTLEASSNYRQLVPGQAYSGSLPWTEVDMKVPLAKLGFNPAAMCQDNLNQKMAQGASKQQVMAKDQVLSKGVWFTAVAQCGKIGKSDDHYGSDFTGAELKIICKAGSAGGIGGIQAKPATPPVGGHAVQTQFQVTNMTFHATPYELNTTCPAKAKFTGNISVSAPGQVKYRVKFPNSTSSVRTLTFDKAGTRSIGVAEYDTNSSIKYAAATLEVIEPVIKKAHTNFKVNCIAAEGPGAVLQQPGQQAAPGAKQIKSTPTPTPKLQVNTPTPKPQLQKIEPAGDPKPAVRRLPVREAEEEEAQRTR